MKRILFVLLTLCCIEVADAQTFGYSYGSGRCDVQSQTPIAEPGAGRPEAVWAVSGNLQPFGTCANDLDTPPLWSFACRQAQTAYHWRTRKP